jgi:hypothetical protein
MNIFIFICAQFWVSKIVTPTEILKRMQTDDCIDVDTLHHWVNNFNGDEVRISDLQDKELDIL